MPSPEELSPFYGADENASGWLQSLVAATGSFSDSGIFRLLGTKFLHDSPAREWFDGLSNETKSSWILFERQFNDRWIIAPLVQSEEEARWKEFCNHRLTYEMVFAHPNPNLSAGIVAAWADEHLQLGRITHHAGLELYQKTVPLLPAFIQTYLHEYEFKSFKNYCDRIKAVPLSTYEVEWIRHQETSKDMDLLQAQIKEISGKIDSILATLDSLRTGVIALPASPPQDHTIISASGPDGSITWEPCSPLTSVASVGNLSETSESVTPIAGETPLPVIVEAAGDLSSTSTAEEDLLISIPRHWRKPSSSLNRKDRIDIVDKAIDFILKFDTDIVADYACNVNSAVAIYDRFIHGQVNCGNARVLFPTKGYSGDLFFPIELIHRYRADGHPGSLLRCKEKWIEFFCTDKITSHSGVRFMHSMQPPIESNWTSGSAKPHMQVPGQATMAGGVYIICSWPRDIRIHSYQTVQFMTLSSYLAESTNDPEFLKFAIQSATCVKKYMLDSERQLVKHCYFDMQTSEEKPESTPSCLPTGIFIEGLSVLASVTGDNSWGSLAISIAEAAMSSKMWHGNDGILSVDSYGIQYQGGDNKSFKGLLNRGLMVAYQRNPTNKAFRQLVRSYVNVQFNALLDLSSRQNSYGIDWRGPYVGPYPHGQIAALDTLVAAVVVNEG